MSIKKQDKLKSLLHFWPNHTVATSKWLRTQGLSYGNLSGYERSGWVRRIGTGAFLKASDSVSWEGAIYGLQKQYPGLFYVGGRTSLELLGVAHFIPMSKSNIFLFCIEKRGMPHWLANYSRNLDTNLQYLQYAILPKELGLTTYDCGEFQITVSTRERAVLELVELLGRFHTFEECRLLFENLGTLRPKLVQKLLEACTSIKAKRVFLFLSKRLKHKWFKDLDLARIDLGSGPRKVEPDGIYDSEFRITYPKGFFDDDKLEV
jgi:hypothetical protein